MPHLRPVHVADLLIISSFVVERMLRQGQSARSFQAEEDDRGSTRAVGSAFGRAALIMTLAPLLNRRHVGQVGGERLAWGGVAAILAGILFRAGANRVLGGYYTRTLKTQEGQRLVTSGPYRLVRHPGYAGSLLMWLGAGIATENVIAALAMNIPLVRAYLLRMEAEEAMLATAFPEEYPDYARRTWRLIPAIY